MLRTLSRHALLLPLALSTAVMAQEHPDDILVEPLIGSPLVTDDEASRDLHLVDLDGDGDLDVIVANLDQDNAVYWNDGSGVFTRETQGALVNDGGNSRGIATGDIDGDGDLDVFIANSADQVNFLYENLGPAAPGATPTFVRVLSGEIATGIANSRKPKFVDVDGDEDLDLVVANFNNHPNDLHINQGGAQGGVEGTFTRVSSGDIVADGGVSYDCDLADIDLDGDLDLFVTNHDGLLPPTPGNPNFLFLNDGAGDFSRVTTGAVVTDVANSLACGFADYDDDGDMDLFVGNDEFDDNDLYQNDGTGAFGVVTSGPIVEDRGESIGSVWSDVDGDGDVDLMLANRFGQPNSLYLNRREGVFERQSFGPIKQEQAESYAVDVGDLDGDERLDVVVANLDRANVAFRNLGSQWESIDEPLAGVAGAPSLDVLGNLLVGQVFQMNIGSAAATAPTIVVAGFSPLFAPLKGGVLVPSPDVVIEGLVTNGAGELIVQGHLSEALPPGLDLFFQAWIVDAAGPKGLAATNAQHGITP